MQLMECNPQNWIHHAVCDLSCQDARLPLFEGNSKTAQMMRAIHC